MDPIDELLNRRVEKILPSKENLASLLRSGKKIRLYQGFDPTGGRLHLGHTVGLRKLMDFANAGHEVIFLFGTGTVLVGDPSLRDSGRKLITQKEIDENIIGWQKQTSKIIDFSKVTIKQNSDWLVPLTLKDIINIASNISAVQLFKRDSFQRRIDRGDTVWYYETMYPLLQGYDSVVMDVDLEIGGTDQEFNMLIGRELQRKMNHREKFVLTTPMIVGTDGETMSKSSGNCVFLDDTPENMFGKLMGLRDDQIVTYLSLVTDIPLPHVEEISQGLKDQSLHPMLAKKELARAVVTQFYSKDEAETAQHNFTVTVQQKEAPTDIPSIPIPKNPISIFQLLTLVGVGESNSQIKRLIEQGGVEIDGQKITDPLSQPNIQSGSILKFGKRTYVKLVIKE
jgi:tyrosyl-tRNA synthetase